LAYLGDTLLQNGLDPVLFDVGLALLYASLARHLETTLPGPLVTPVIDLEGRLYEDLDHVSLNNSRSQIDHVNCINDEL
jgi:hypothetical protein